MIPWLLSSDRKVKPDHVRNSIGSEVTFAADISDLGAAKAELAPLVAKIWAYCGARNMTAKTVTVKVKYSDFQQITRSRTQTLCFVNEAEVLGISESLLETVYPFRKGVRLLGVTDRKSTRLNSSHLTARRASRMPSSA